MQTLKRNILDILIKCKHIDAAMLENALDIQKQRQVPLKKILIEQRVISEEELLAVLSEQLFIPTLNLSKYKFDPALISLIPERVARQYCVIPLSRMGNTLTVAVSDPLNIFALDDLRITTGLEIDVVLSSEDDILKAIASQYRQDVTTIQQLISEGQIDESQGGDKGVEVVKPDEIELSSAVQDSEKPPIVKLTDVMLRQALLKRASDIHIEPEKDCLRVRYRIDGALHDAFKIPKTNQNAVLARLKIISNLDITENRLPQDGRFKVRYEAKEIDFRVSALPTTFGQKFVLRLLDKSNLSYGLDNLGYSEYPLTVFRDAITKPFGMLLVTGPTGSGKSTTLYTILNQLNVPERNIITIEDPVEYRVNGITQVQVKSDIEFTFASGLRAILRQSPDIIMVGEIRDSETADIAIKAALTGQLVLSTLHTNDAISSITRLIDMGVEPFLVASSLVMVSAQRLARKMCSHCKKPVTYSEEFLKSIGFEGHADFYSTEGCKYCNYTGFYGRMAIIEAVLVDDTMREMIIKKQPIDEIKEYSRTQGMKMLRDDAFLKVREEKTTLEEALRITTEE
jgi:type IV pilus assembly protein PilB